MCVVNHNIARWILIVSVFYREFTLHCYASQIESIIGHYGVGKFYVKTIPSLGILICTLHLGQNTITILLSTILHAGYLNSKEDRVPLWMQMCHASATFITLFTQTRRFRRRFTSPLDNTRSIWLWHASSINYKDNL